ncbi:MAG: MFS transporter [Phycisphaerae bacterium]|nr:MFS transporter [Phycisphaerae bacterium]
MSHPRVRLVLTCLAHAVVDFFSCIIVPLLTVLEGRVSISPGQGAVLIGLGSLSSGLIQPIVAWLSDRFDTRLLGTLGTLVAAVAIGLVGYAHTFPQLIAIQVLGAAGVGAFHPVAAAAVGHLSGRRRSMGVSWFFTAGMVGGVAGSLVAPPMNARFGLEAFAWTIIPGVILAGLLAWAIHGAAHRRHDAHERHGSATPEQRRERWRAVWVLYAGNALRFTVNMALVQLLVRWSETIALARGGASVLDASLRAQAATINGPMQAAMAVGMGVSGLLAGMVVPTRHERRALVLVPCAGAAAVALVPYAGGAGALALAVGCGIGYAGVIPLTIAMAQRLLPHRTGLASGLMMGGAWSVAAAGPPLAQWLIRGVGLTWSFAVVAGLLVVAGLVSMALPGAALRDTAHH